jgi:hypothetical protein
MKILNLASQPGQRTLRQPSLLLCILFDLIGYASYSVPILGEFADVLWAPFSGFVFFLMFGGWRGAMGGVFNFIEELLPGTDFIPSFTLMWLMRSSQNRQRTPRMQR